MTQPPQGGGIVSDNPWHTLQEPSEGSAEEAGGPASMDTQEAPKPTADVESQTADSKADEPMPGTAEDRVAEERGEESERAEPDAQPHVAPASPGVVSVDMEEEQDNVGEIGEAYEALGRTEEPVVEIVPDDPEPGTNRWEHAAARWPNLPAIAEKQP